MDSTEELWEAYRDKRVVVTGGGGYLGANLIGALSATPCDIVRLVRHKMPIRVVGTEARIHDVVGDIRDGDVWRKLLSGADVVFHLAAQTSASAANRDPVYDLAANVTPLLSLLQSIRQSASQPFVVFSGTVTAVGIAPRLPVDETFTDVPITIYDLHKLTAERHLEWYVSEGLARGATLRLANVFGPGPQSSSVDRGILNQMINKAVRGERLTVYGLGRQVRDYTFVEDTTRAFLMAGACWQRTNGRHFVLGSGVGHTIREAAELVADAVAVRTGVRVDVETVAPPTPQAPIEARDFVADTGRFREATGWLPQHTFAEGLARTVEWALAGGDLKRAI